MQEVQVTYNNYLDEDLNRDVLTKDADFITDASDFLRKRTNQEFDTADEVYDAYLEHMRFHDTNEVTTVRDLMYAQEADLEDKNAFARLLDAYDRMEGEDLFGQTDQFAGFNWDKVGDYGEAILKAPSTLLGIVTGGSGKLAGISAKEAAKLGTRTILREALKSGLKGGAVEAGIGAGQSVAKQATRVETGNQEGISGTQVIADALISGAVGALPSAASGAFYTRRAAPAKLMQESAEQKSAEVAETAAKNVKEKFDGIADKSKIVTAKEEILGEKLKDAKEYLKQVDEANKAGNALDPDMVREGQRLLAGLSKTEKFLLNSLDGDVLDSVTAAAMDLGEELGRKEGQRITTAVASAIADGRITTTQIDEIMSKYGLTSDQFSYIYMAELSDAGRTLQKASQSARGQGKTSATGRITTEQANEQLGRLASAVETFLDEAGSVRMSKDDALAIAEDAAKSRRVYTAIQSVDRFRLAMMTGQLATTMRNMAGGGFRVVTDAADTMFANSIRLAGKGLAKAVGKDMNIRMDNPLEVAKYLVWSPAEAGVIREMFGKKMPVEANQFFSQFFEAAEVANRTGTADGLNFLGAKVNTLNRMSDNMYKQAVFAGTLSREVKASGKFGGRDLSEVIADGDFNKIDKELFEKAIDDAYYFVYQRAPKGETLAGEVGKTVVDLHRKVPFVVSAFVPFPRFVINQLQFTAEHMPVFGLLAHKMGGKKALTTEAFAHQASGLAMFSIAYNMRSDTANNGEWYHYITEDGNKVDMRPIAGPMNAFLLAADIVYRYKNGLPDKDASARIKDYYQAFGGPQFRAGTGLSGLDRLIENSASTGEVGMLEGQTAAKFAGDLVNTFTLPVATIRDILSLSDEAKRVVPESGYTDLLDIFAITATKSLADLDALGIDFSLTSLIAGEDSEIDIEKGRPDVVTGEVMTRKNPLERQIFGAGSSGASNPLQRKLTELGMTPFDLYRPSEYPFLDRELREEFADDISRELNDLVSDTTYLKMPSSAQKGRLRERASELSKRYREIIVEKARVERPEEYDQYRFESLPKDTRKGLRDFYEENYGKEMGMDFAGALELQPAFDQATGKRK